MGTKGGSGGRGGGGGVVTSRGGGGGVVAGEGGLVVNAVSVDDGVGLSSRGDDGVCSGVGMMVAGVSACVGKEDEKCGVGLRDSR